MTTITELRELQREYVENRDACFVRIERQDRNLSNCMPGPSTLRECRENEARWRTDASVWQKRIDAIQTKLDEIIGVSP